MVSLLLNGAALARRRDSDEDDFPNYDKVEYAKPLPPVDQQVPQPKPGSFHLRVGDPKPTQDASMDDIPVQLMDNKKHADDSEPALDFAAAESQVFNATPTANSSTSKR